MVTKVRVENAASRRAVEKAGFVAAAEMRVRRRGWRTSLRILPGPPGAPQLGWLRSIERGRSRDDGRAAG
jgi:RimJ/RimL family protein N-acetyltransferase